MALTLTLAPSLAFAEEGAASGKATADDSTLTTWEGHAKDNTANIGRIWTDKSVSTDSFTLSGDVEGGAGVTINKTDGLTSSWGFPPSLPPLRSML